MRRSSIRLAAALFVLLNAPFSPAKDEWSGVERIVAVGDVHGDYAQFTTLLRQTALIDEDEDWAGGRAHLVQTGDVVDRGPDSRKVIDLLRKLEKQARKAKGRVHALIGNHEAMNVYGDLRYIHRGEFAEFETRRSRQLLEAAFEAHAEGLRQSRPPEELPDLTGDYRLRWFDEHPPGWVEHREAFATSGEYGKWIASRQVAVKINDTLFLHGGISPQYVDWTLKQINERVAIELGDFSLLVEGGMLTASEGPVWYRGLAEKPEEEERAHVDRTLESFGIRRVVIGHTPTDGTVVPRFGGRVVQIDVGLSAAYGGRLACLVIEGDAAYVVHRGTRLELPNEEDGLLDYFEKAAALDPSPSPLAARIARMKPATTADTN